MFTNMMIASILLLLNRSPFQLAQIYDLCRHIRNSGSTLDTRMSPCDPGSCVCWLYRDHSITCFAFLSRNSEITTRHALIVAGTFAVRRPPYSYHVASLLHFSSSDASPRLAACRNVAWAKVVRGSITFVE